MAQKIFNVEGIGPVLVAKRKGTRHLRLSITSSGQVRVGLPTWAPYSAGVAFAKSRLEWIEKHQPHKLTDLKDGDRIGKSYRLAIQINKGSAVRSKLSGNLVIITAPSSVPAQDLQARIVKAAERALKTEAAKLLPMRLSELAKKYGYSYSSVEIKKLTSRWGSCSSKRKITLSYYLMQLPWNLIDYVLLHELVHTHHLSHGVDFWNEFTGHMPAAKAYRSEVKAYRPIIAPST